MNEHLRVSIDHLLEGVQVIGFDWQYLYVNDTAAEHGQRTADELIGRTMPECYPGIDHTDVFAIMRQVMETRQRSKLRNEFTYPTGERRWFDLRVEPVPAGICVLSLDVTDEHESHKRLRVLEGQLRDAQRLEAVGRLAGGIAHDFNNQLTAILGFAQLLVEQELPDDAARDVREIQSAAERSSALTRQLLAFSRRQVLKMVPTDLNEVVANVSRMLGRVLGANIVLDVRSDRAVDRMLGDAGQLEHIITNLALNSRDAMPSGGRLTISTSTVNLTDDDARQHPSMKSGRYAVLSVADTGHGMDEATKTRIFDPFFTTKAPGKGTGLGLAMVYGAVGQMGGFVWVYSEVAKGTTFRLYFPVTAETHQADSAVSPSVEPLNLTGRRVLVIDDDRAVRELIARVLGRQGCEVVQAQSAEDARVLLDTAGAFDLMLVDVVLPGQSGPDFVRAMAHRTIPAVFMSGYSEQQVRSANPSADVRFVEKPFTGRDLLSAVRGALGGLSAT